MPCHVVVSDWFVGSTGCHLGWHLIHLPFARSLVGHIITTSAPLDYHLCTTSSPPHHQLCANYMPHHCHLDFTTLWWVTGEQLQALKSCESSIFIKLACSLTLLIFGDAFCYFMDLNWWATSASNQHTLSDPLQPAHWLRWPFSAKFTRLPQDPYLRGVHLSPFVTSSVAMGSMPTCMGSTWVPNGHRLSKSLRL